MPLHEHLIAQGFIEMVQRVGKGALFYNDKTPQRASADPLKPPRSRADTARATLVSGFESWVLSIPNSAQTIRGGTRSSALLTTLGCPEKMNDAITGHTQATEGPEIRTRRAWRPWLRRSRNFRATSWIER